MTPPLPDPFLTVPIAHRGLHDSARGIPENSMSAVLAALDAGYGIEIDVQMTADERAVVFHDYDLVRLTEKAGLVRDTSLADMQANTLTGGDMGAPSLVEVLQTVAGQAPLLIEIKDQDGALGPDVGPLEQDISDAIRDYPGPLAVMSFNPHSVARMKDLAPTVPRGLVTDPFAAKSWPKVPTERRVALAGIPDFDAVAASFISHDARDLGHPRVAELKAGGAAILCWTVRSPEEETAARKIADNITFEGYSAPQHWT